MTSHANNWYYRLTRDCLAKIGEAVSLEPRRLWQSFDCHYARHVYVCDVDGAETYAAVLRASCIDLLNALNHLPDEREQLHPFLNALAAISQWCFATGNSIDDAVRPFTAGYVDMLIACGQAVADQHAHHIAFDYAARFVFGGDNAASR